MQKGQNIITPLQSLVFFLHQKILCNPSKMFVNLGYSQLTSTLAALWVEFMAIQNGRQTVFFFIPSAPSHDVNKN